MRALITGGTGLIGSALCENLVKDGHEPIVLTRNPNDRKGLPSQTQLVKWDAKTTDGWGHLAGEVDVIVNLVGESLADGRWSDERKQRILNSRVTAGRLLLQAIDAAPIRPQALIQASAKDYYGPQRDEPLGEDAGPGSDYLAHVCFEWEASTAPVERLGVRRPVIRTGIVLSTEGGALPKILLPFKLFAGGPIGSGKQWWSWIHLLDEVRAIRFLMEHESATGPYNLTAPNPLTNKEFASVVGDVMGRPAFFPVPSPVLRTAFGAMSTVLLDGQRALPCRLEEAGFIFDFPTLDAALKDLLK